MPGEALGHLGRIGRDIGLQQIKGIELRQQPDDLSLGWRVVTQLLDDVGPNLVNGPLPVHLRDEKIGRRRETMHAARRLVLDHIPGRAPVPVPVNIKVLAQLRPETANAMPGCVEECFGHTAMASTSRWSAAANPAATGSRSPT